ncbi:hypothetical protein ACH5RR_007343 [Cinchona calisaya]|uniref:Phorbol-ester/DAG-type domain-containing protein n=1 Tax=Cinchona calisaya TaxID=153742 RepID=A0ABD3ARI3_9GENT
MERLKHFSHAKHPLILTQVENHEAKKSNCYGCQKPILSEPTYTCKECNIFLHKKCAKLPIEIMLSTPSRRTAKLKMNAAFVIPVNKNGTAASTLLPMSVRPQHPVCLS